MVEEDIIARNRARQTEWYGEPLGERFRRLLDRLGLPQSALAEALGLSAPMLSQLMSGHRAKISNPAVMSRLIAIESMVTEPGFVRLSAAQTRERLEQIRAQSASTPSPLRIAVPPRQPAPDPVSAIQSLLRGLASAAEIEGAAKLLEDDYPDLAELLRVYGNGRTGEARTHYTRFVNGV